MQAYESDHLYCKFVAACLITHAFSCACTCHMRVCPSTNKHPLIPNFWLNFLYSYRVKVYLLVHKSLPWSELKYITRAWSFEKHNHATSWSSISHTWGEEFHVIPKLITVWLCVGRLATLENTCRSTLTTYTTSVCPVVVQSKQVQ